MTVVTSLFKIEIWLFSINGFIFFFYVIEVLFEEFSRNDFKRCYSCQSPLENAHIIRSIDIEHRIMDYDLYTINHAPKIAQTKRNEEVSSSSSTEETREKASNCSTELFAIYSRATRRSLGWQVFIHLGTRLYRFST
jgi:hypothetical protein